MRPPDEVFPARKKIQFDKTGRPFHYMFFTRFPHYYEMCHVCSLRRGKLTEREKSILT